MALNDNTRELLRAVAENDLVKARNAAYQIVENEKASGNQSFCNSIKSKLDSKIQLLDVPYYLKGILQVEDVSNFREDRYLLTKEQEQLFNQIVRAKNTNEKLSEMGIRYLNSTLLYGESGTGKTTFGRYLAYKLGVPFCYLSFAKCIDSYMGKTSSNIEAAIMHAKSIKNCVFMIDEIDAIGIQRNGNSGVDGEMNRVVISLMQSLDNLDNDLIVLGATNRPDMLDSALRRRFTY